MNKQSKPAPQPLRKESPKSKPKVSQTGPSVDVNHQPIPENDDSINLFEDNIEKFKNEEKC
jgi:hypothetical protein